MQNFLKNMGENIKYLRKNLGYSQEILAEKIGVSRNYIEMIERAEVNTPIETLYLIARTLNTEIIFLRFALAFMLKYKS